MAALRIFRLSCSINAVISRKASNFSLQETTICNFRDSDVLDNWTCTSDEEFGGKSRVELVRTNTDHVSFKGMLSTELPLDRATKHSGFSAMRSNPVMVTFLNFCFEVVTLTKENVLILACDFLNETRLTPLDPPRTLKQARQPRTDMVVSPQACGLRPKTQLPNLQPATRHAVSVSHLASLWCYIFINAKEAWLVKVGNNDTSYTVRQVILGA